MYSWITSSATVPISGILVDMIISPLLLTNWYTSMELYCLKSHLLVVVCTVPIPCFACTHGQKNGCRQGGPGGRKDGFAHISGLKKIWNRATLRHRTHPCDGRAFCHRYIQFRRSRLSKTTACDGHGTMARCHGHHLRPRRRWNEQRDHVGGSEWAEQPCNIYLAAVLPSACKQCHRFVEGHYVQRSMFGTHQ